jgi:hypothetical protein
MRLAGNVALNLKNNMSTEDVFLDFEKAFEKTQFPELQHKLSESEFSRSPIKLMATFSLTENLRVFVEGDFSTQRKTVTGAPQGSILDPILKSLHNNYFCSRRNWNSSFALCGCYLCLCDRGTQTSCSLQTATRPHCSEIVT